MRRMNLKEAEEGHNFWQNYTDLMSGFLIVFIIASLVAYSSYKVYVDLYHEKGITEANINDIVINAELYQKIREFQEAQRSLNSEYFRYNSDYSRYECKIDVQFTANDFENIRPEYIEPLTNAGRELDSIITNFSRKTGVQFKVVVEGRLANDLTDGGIHWVTPENEKAWNEALVNSYKRAKTVVDLWQKNGIMTDLLTMDNAKTAEQSKVNGNYSGELFICGAGYGGQHRYKCSRSDPQGEDKNKTFIIQIIPYINF